MTCIAPGCRLPRLLGMFCQVHAAAPAGQRGGWLSAYKRRLRMSEHETEAIDASNVFPKLWVGSKPPTDRELARFTLIALCAREYQPERASWRGRALRVPLIDDFPERNDVHTAVLGARQVATELQRGGTVLVTCQMGRNRSAWVAGMAMLIVAPRMTPTEAMMIIRHQRSPQCLSNPHFVKVMHQIWAKRMPPRAT